MDLVSVHDRIKAGDPEAEVEFYLWLQTHRYSLCENLWYLAEDVATETWQYLVKRIKAGEIREPRALTGLAKMVGFRECKAIYRKNKHIDRDISVETCRPKRRHGDSGIDTDADMYIEDRSPRADEVLLQKQVWGLVISALDSMSQHRAEILRRFYVLEQSPELIMAEMGLTPTQYRLSKSRGIKELRKQLNIPHKTRRYTYHDDHNNQNN